MNGERSISREIVGRFESERFTFESERFTLETVRFGKRVPEVGPDSRLALYKDAVKMAVVAMMTWNNFSPSCKII